MKEKEERRNQRQREEEEAEEVLDKWTSSPAQKVNARIILGMSEEDALKLEEKGLRETDEAWEKYLESIGGIY